MTPTIAPSLVPWRVLVVDDSRVARQLVRARLASEGIQVSEAPDGEAGLARARAERPDLIVLDLHLPGWDGFETIRHLKADPATRLIPIIFQSASASTQDKARGLDLGAVDFLTKPVDPVELRARVRAALRTKYLLDLLEQRAHLDGLTGLGNRHALEERLVAEGSSCRRRSCPLSILIADLDHFKRVNDAHGHGAGDEVLRRSAVLLRDAVRAGDFVARYGGEEFVVVAPDCDPAGVAVMAERFRVALAAAEFPSLEGNSRAASTIRLTVSVGVATGIDAPPGDPAEILFQADQALYRAKATGRNAVWAWDRDENRPRPAVLSPSGVTALLG